MTICRLSGPCQRIEDQRTDCKKAYDSLEQEGFTVTIHGKGTYVAAANKEMMMEEYRREVEEELTEVIRKAKDTACRKRISGRCWS